MVVAGASGQARLSRAASSRTPSGSWIRPGSNSTFNKVTPVTLPPGRLRLGDKVHSRPDQTLSGRRLESSWPRPLLAKTLGRSQQSRSPDDEPDRAPLPGVDRI